MSCQSHIWCSGAKAAQGLKSDSEQGLTARLNPCPSQNDFSSRITSCHFTTCHFTNTKGTRTMTKLSRIAISLLVLLSATVVLAQTDAQKSFDKLKSLSGSWEGKDHQGKAVQVSFRETAGGSALMSEIQGRGPENMISMFNLDGANRLLVTHYCGAGNQPRMTASASPDGKTISFDFLDATNLAGPEAGHMRQLVITVLDANHHTEEWNFADHGKEMKEVFDLYRKN